MGERQPFSIWKILAVLGLSEAATLAWISSRRLCGPGADQSAWRVSTARTWSSGRSGAEECSAPVGEPGSERMDVLGLCPVGGQSSVGVALQHREDPGEDVPVEAGVCLFGEAADSLA